MTIITGLASIFIFPRLCDKTTLGDHVSPLYLGFLASLLVFGAYLWIGGPDGSPVFVLSALFFGHVFGLPLFLLILLAQIILIRLGFYRSD